MAIISGPLGAADRPIKSFVLYRMDIAVCQIGPSCKLDASNSTRPAASIGPRRVETARSQRVGARSEVSPPWRQPIYRPNKKKVLPAVTATTCLPFKIKETGVAFVGGPRFTCHNSFPVAVSSAKTVPA